MALAEERRNMIRENQLTELKNLKFDYEKSDRNLRRKHEEGIADLDKIKTELSTEKTNT